MIEPREKELRTTLLVLRIQAFAMCYAAPVVYVGIYAIAVLQGRWSRLLQGFDSVPWTNPLVLGLLAMSLATLGGAFLLPRFLSKPKGLPGLRTRSTLTFALIESVAIYGLVLGFVLGGPAATLVLALALVPPAACPLLLVSEEQAREALGDHA